MATTSVLLDKDAGYIHINLENINLDASPENSIDNQLIEKTREYILWYSLVFILYQVLFCDGFIHRMSEMNLEEINYA